VTIAKLADALATKPYRILAELIRRLVLPAPGDTLEDGIAQEVAAMQGVYLRIIDDGDGDAPGPVVHPDFPPIPPGLTTASKMIKKPNKPSHPTATTLQFEFELPPSPWMAYTLKK